MHEIASYIVLLADDVGATDWPADLHLGDVIEKHIGRTALATIERLETENAELRKRLAGGAGK